ncbi:MAG: hypothetical protein U0974_12060 [Gemmatimonadales bacterium]|nr:hypothetical protein [Gemmatimonadales bacterium]
MSTLPPEFTPAHRALADQLIQAFEERKQEALATPDGEAGWWRYVISEAQRYIQLYEHGDVMMLAELDVALPEEMEEIEDMVRLFLVIEKTGMGEVYIGVRDGVYPFHSLPILGPLDDDLL